MWFTGLTNDALALVEYALNLVARGCTLDLSGEVAHGGHRRRRLLLRFLQYLAVRIGSTAECTWYNTTDTFPWKVAVVPEGKRVWLEKSQTRVNLGAGMSSMTWRLTWT